MKTTAALIVLTAMLVACKAPGEKPAPVDAAPVATASHDGQGAAAQPSAAKEEAAQSSQAVVPAGFRGAWATDLAECAADESSGKMSLTIGAKDITYSETSDAVISVNEIGPERVSLTVDHDNDGDIRRLERTLTLSKDRQTLSFIYGDEPQVVIRCPQG